MQKGVKPLEKTAVKRRSRADPSGLRGIHSVSTQYLGLAVLILIGILIGTLMARQSGASAKNNFGFFLQNMFSSESASKGFFPLFLSSFFSSSIPLCIAFFFGLCALGLPFELLLPVFKGAGIGLAMGYVYYQYGIKGMLICAIFILPQSLLVAFAIMIAAREGIRFSLLIAGNIFRPLKQKDLWSDFSRYCFKYVICCVILIVASLVESLCTICFSAMFFS